MYLSSEVTEKILRVLVETKILHKLKRFNFSSANLEQYETCQHLAKFIATSSNLEFLESTCQENLRKIKVEIRYANQDSEGEMGVVNIIDVYGDSIICSELTNKTLEDNQVTIVQDF